MMLVLHIRNMTPHIRWDCLMEGSASVTSREAECYSVREPPLSFSTVQVGGMFSGTDRAEQDVLAQFRMREIDARVRSP